MYADYPDGTSPNSPGNTMELSPGFASPWYQSGTLTLIAGGVGSFTLSFTDPEYIYFVDMVNISPTSGHPFNVVFSLNGIPYVAAAGSAWLNIPLRQNPSLCFLEKDVVVVTVTNHAATTLTYSIKLMGTAILKPSGYGHAPQCDIVVEADSYVHPAEITFHDQTAYLTPSNFNFYTYWLYCGDETPLGFELISDVGGMAYHRLLSFGEGSMFPALGADPDAVGWHNHGFQITSITTTGAYNVYASDYGSAHTVQFDGWHHSSATFTMSEANALPICKTLKLLRYPGMPQSLPLDIIVLFQVDVPAGYTRYSEQDGFHVYCSDTVGEEFGSYDHVHTVNYRIAGSAATVLLYSNIGNRYCTESGHTHTGSHDLDPVDNIVSTCNLILGKVTSVQTTLPVSTIILSSSTLDDYTVSLVSAHGGVLHERYLMGESTRDYGVTHVEHDHVTHTFNSCEFDQTNYAPFLNSWDVTLSHAWHIHVITIAVDPMPDDSIIPYFRPYASIVTSEIDLAAIEEEPFYGEVTRDWDFGDNTAHSDEKDPVHTYTEAGTYTVKLYVTNAYGWDSSYYTVVIT
jgi:hypothetical protein